MTDGPKRIPPIDLQHLAAEQQEVAERIAGTRGGRVPGPFTALLHVPKLADHVQGLGAYLRFEGDLDRGLAETAILVVAKRWESAYVWNAHEPIARRAGVTDAVIGAVAGDQSPEPMSGRDRLVCDFARELTSSGRVRDELYAAVAEDLGLGRTIELTVLIGYYSLIAMTLNALGWE